MNYLQFFSTVVVLKHRSFAVMGTIGAELDKTVDYELTQRRSFRNEFFLVLMYRCIPA